MAETEQVGVREKLNQVNFVSIRVIKRPVSLAPCETQATTALAERGKNLLGARGRRRRGVSMSGTHGGSSERKERTGVRLTLYLITRFERRIAWPICCRVLGNVSHTTARLQLYKSQPAGKYSPTDTLPFNNPAFISPDPQLYDS